MQPLQNCIGPTICIGRQILCLPYAGFFNWRLLFSLLPKRPPKRKKVNLLYIVHSVWTLAGAFTSSKLYIALYECPRYMKELGFYWTFSNYTTFPFPCTYICYSIQLTDAQNKGFRTKFVLLTHFGQFVQDKSFIKKIWF